MLAALMKALKWRTASKDDPYGLSTLRTIAEGSTQQREELALKETTSLKPFSCSPPVSQYARNEVNFGSALPGQISGQSISWIRSHCQSERNGPTTTTRSSVESQPIPLLTVSGHLLTSLSSFLRGALNTQLGETIRQDLELASLWDRTEVVTDYSTSRQCFVIQLVADQRIWFQMHECRTSMQTLLEQLLESLRPILTKKASPPGGNFTNFQGRWLNVQ